jgi:hypothetical protein
MPEIHTVDFNDVGINVLSDPDHGTITLQYVRENHGTGHVGRILAVLRRRYGKSTLSRLNRWRDREENPFVLPSCSTPHPDNPDILRFEIKLQHPEQADAALALLLGFLRQQPGYRRTLGAPLDRDHAPRREAAAPERNASEFAGDVLTQMFMRHREKSNDR